ncbi:hypothetical protein BKA82DRAFT_10425 [Pisolithus tinctorius]|uniref:Uncharacterized protein n=1 Tax=Pisolithus tinctorius Marx 270 TaxID=870435 RepID=A0A0C3IQC1_PISTI|nr:hypothetical protein BKA82DRAFT_10425 [Pisolithus tinctorius]KIN99152.1 hypothetical protein M404DRAFT_10425 [Pisolithus tinctorius Marx 270]
MPAYEIHGPFGLKFNLQTRVPGVLSIIYASGEEESMTVPARSCSEPTAESSQGPSFGRRTQSEVSLYVPTPIYPPAGTDNLAEIHRASAPSPVPTEIIPTDLTSEDIVEDIQRMGIKVRDFAYEPVSLAQLAPELFDPIMAYNYYEDAVANPDPQRPPCSGRNLRRLIDLGWVSEAADRPRWQKKDVEALEAFDSRPHYPWEAYKLLMPTKDKLKEVARARLQFVHGGQWPPEVLARGLARIGGFLPQDTSSGKRPADVADTESQSEGPPSKKLRSLGDTPAGTQVQSMSGQYTPLALVNGKAPQQFPAGRLPENPSPPLRPASTPVASNLGTPRQSSETPSPDSRIQRPLSTPASGEPPKQYPAGYPSDGSPCSSLTKGSPVGRPLQRQQTMPSLPY